LIQQEASEAAEAGFAFISVRSPFGTADKIVHQLAQSFPKANLTVERSEGVGPIMGTQLATTIFVRPWHSDPGYPRVRHDPIRIFVCHRGRS